ncbi:MAG: hypothetical protein J0H64_06820, partial [Actinobacteria bacterium]|nr:hypothetical protein [Actinomycetota bacterium]
MAQQNPRIFSLPPGWGGASTSKKPPQLLAAELFHRSFTPSPDAYLHVAMLRAAPTAIFVASAAIAVFCGWLSVITFAGLAQLPADQRVIGIVIG